MNLDTLISSNAVIVNPEIKSKKRALELLAEKLAIEANLINSDSAIRNATEDTDSEGINSEDMISENTDDANALEIFQLLTDREKLGSTSLGHGVALPHARTTLTEHAIGVFLKLDNGIDFDNPDNQKTDLIFALMVPEHYTDEHLKILAHLASLFSNEDFCQKLRSLNNSQDLYNNLINWQLASQAS
jgi:PTS system nitrogen regulatory IIA component